MALDGCRHIGGEIKLVSNQIQRCVHMDKQVPQLTRGQGLVIHFIRMRDKEGIVTYQRDVEKQYDIRRSSATEMLQLLEKNGYLTKESVAEDARLKKLLLTEKAIEADDQIKAYIENFERNLLEGISAEEQDTLLHILEKVKRNLGRMESGEKAERKE